MAHPELPEEYSVTVDGKAVAIRYVEPRLAIRWALYRAAVVNDHQAYLAALGLVYGRVRTRVPYKHDPLDFGARVLEHLDDDGWQYPQMVAAGQWAFVHATHGLIKPSEVEERADFFDEAPTGDTPA